MGELSDYLPLMILALPLVAGVLYWGAIGAGVFGLAAGVAGFFGVDLLGGALGIVARTAALPVAILVGLWALKRLPFGRDVYKGAAYAPFVILSGITIVVAKYALTGTLLAAGATSDAVVAGPAVTSEFLTGIIAGIVVAIGAIKAFKLR